MKIEIGEYVRLDRCQGIRKIDDYDEENKRYELDEIIADEYGDETWFLDINDVINHSKNIIDLIEIGDVVKTGVNKSFLHILVTKKDLEHFKKVYKNNQDLIKSIVTKEQFNNMEYRV